MQLEIKVDPSAIEKHVVDSIVASAFGERLKEAINTSLKSLNSGNYYNDQLKGWVAAEMGRLVRETIEKEYKPIIEAQIRDKITPQLLSEACARVVDEGMRRVRLSNDY